MIYSKQAVEVRNFFKDVLGWKYVEEHPGWLIFAMPPAEVGIHPIEEGVHPHGKPIHELYLMCDNINKTVEELETKGVKFKGGVKDEGWGLLTTIVLPGGGELGMYEPRHKKATDL